MIIKNDKFLLKSLFITIMTVFLVSGIANAATVRPTNRTSAKKTDTTTTQQTNTDSGTNTVKKKKAKQVETVADEEIEPEIIENKASMFDDAIGSDLGFGDSVSGDSELAEQIRKQRASAEARDKLNLVSSNQKSGLKNGKNACDDALRQCVQKTCGNDFTKCALDSDTLFGEKLNRCRRDTTCTGEEFKLFTTEIKADRDFNAQMASYQSVIDCGNKYNSCIQNECGATFGKCLGKTAADKAVNNCATIAKNCMEQDSGLSARMGSVIARLREDGEKDVKADEERMYKLRDLMASQCTKLGAMFDERSFDCVYTVNFFAGEDQSNPMASRKRYAGDTFVCTQEWFGTNVTMAKENAYRETRAQTAASSAMLGSGVGTAVGLVTSGAMGRALDTQKAKKELKKEEKAQKADEKATAKVEKKKNKLDKKQCASRESDGCEWDNKNNSCVCTELDEDTAELKEFCQDSDNGGKWDVKNNTCKCPKKKPVWDEGEGCVEKELTIAQEKRNEKRSARKEARQARKDACKDDDGCTWIPGIGAIWHTKEDRQAAREEKRNDRQDRKKACKNDDGCTWVPGVGEVYHNTKEDKTENQNT